MFSSFFHIFLISLAFSSIANCWERGRLELPPNLQQIDFEREATASSIVSEKGLQRQNPEPRIFVGLLAGAERLSPFTIKSANQDTQYNPDSDVAVGGVFVTIQLHKDYRQWQLRSQAAYSYGEYDGANKKALHLIPIQTWIVREFSTKSKFFPYLGIGPSAQIFFQRGLDQNNVSGLGWVTELAAGIRYQLESQTEVRSPASLVVQYSKPAFKIYGDTTFDNQIFEFGYQLGF